MNAPAATKSLTLTCFLTLRILLEGIKSGYKDITILSPPFLFAILKASADTPNSAVRGYLAS
jgi:hypothetical protein